MGWIGAATLRTRIVIWSAGVLTIVLTSCFSTSGFTVDEFHGTFLTSGDAAAPFTLTDQFGEQTSLADFRGKVVLLTFLYTNCPDVCPITTNQLRETLDALGETTKDVAVVSISVDPDRDTVAAALDYSERWKMTDRWSYLVGTDSELAPVWKAYYLDPASLRPSADSESTATSESGLRAKAGIDALVQESYLVIHSAPIYLIDREGIARVVVTHPFDVTDLVDDVQTLVDKG